MRPLLSFPLLLLMLDGCGLVYRLKPEPKRACASPMVELGHDLTFKVDGGDRDGSFEHEVLDWPLLKSTRGVFDLKTGDFWFENIYADNAVREMEHASGYGTIQRSGDLDLGYTLTATWRDESQRQFDIRHLRTGCVEVLRREALDDGELVVTEGTWAGGGMDWVRNFVEGPAAVQGIGRMESDRSWSESVEFSQGGIRTSWLTTGDGNGHQLRTFDDDNGFEKTIGTWERFYDGTVIMDFTRNNPSISRQAWSFQVDLTGTGDGTWEGGEDTCDLIFTDDKCKLRNCSVEALNGKCEVPVTWPEY